MVNTREPFSLGFPDERWAANLHSLIIPIPATDRHVIAQRTHDGGFRIIAQTDLMLADDMLMAAAILQDYLDNYHRGNEGELK